MRPRPAAISARTASSPSSGERRLQGRARPVSPDPPQRPGRVAAHLSLPCSRRLPREVQHTGTPGDSPSPRRRCAAALRASPASSGSPGSARRTPRGGGRAAAPGSAPPRSGGSSISGWTAARRRRRVPRADLLADVAAEDPPPHHPPRLGRERPAVLDRPVGDAAVAVQPVGLGERAGRAGVEAEGAAAAEVGERLVGREVEAEEELRRGGTTSPPPGGAAWCSSPPPRARPAPPARARGPARCPRSAGSRSRGTPRGRAPRAPAAAPPSPRGSPVPRA